MMFPRPIPFSLQSMGYRGTTDHGQTSPRLLSSPFHATASSPQPSLWKNQTKVEREGFLPSQRLQDLEEKRLGPYYKPDLFDVICAKGKEAREHTGNRRFRLLIDMNLEKYRAAGKSKTTKSSIVSDIVDTIRASSSGAGFIKRNEGEWYQVSDHHAREKIGQCFRDRLHTEYKSSSKAKIQKNKIKNRELDSCGRITSAIARRNSDLSTEGTMGRTIHNSSDLSSNVPSGDKEVSPSLLATVLQNEMELRAKERTRKQGGAHTISSAAP